MNDLIVMRIMDTFSRYENGPDGRVTHPGRAHMSNHNGWDSFGDLLAKHGSNTLVPFLGTGFRRWVSDAPSEKTPLVCWANLVDEIAREAALASPEAGDQVLRFDALIDSEARARRCAANEAEESILGTHLRAVLNRDAALAAGRPRANARRAAFLAAGWTDIVDLCVDPFLREGTTDPAVRGRKPGSARARLHGSGTTVWLPHGTAVNYTTGARIVLGTHRYGRAVRSAVQAFDACMAARRNPTRKMPDHWLATTLSRPLLLLGIGMAPQDWDVVWLLQMRSRLNAPHSVFRLTCDADKDRPRARAVLGRALVELHGGRTWVDAWTRLGTYIPAFAT
jgi:hypothetical protein